MDKANRRCMDKEADMEASFVDRKLKALSKQKTMQYNYVQSAAEFLENPSGGEGDDVTGNRVFVSREPDGLLRFKIEIDDFGYVVAALNRLIQRLSPTFQFPVNKKRA